MTMGWSPSPNERHPPFPMSAMYRSRQPQKTLLIIWDPDVASNFSFLWRYESQKITIHTPGAAGHNLPVETTCSTPASCWYAFASTPSPSHVTRWLLAWQIAFEAVKRELGKLIKPASYLEQGTQFDLLEYCSPQDTAHSVKPPPDKNRLKR